MSRRGLGDRTARPRRRRGHRFPRCPETGKVRLGERKDARLALQDCRRLSLEGEPDSSARRRECRAYRCGYCSGWHLTSQPARREGKQGPRLNATLTSKADDVLASAQDPLMARRWA